MRSNRTRSTFALADCFFGELPVLLVIGSGVDCFLFCLTVLSFVFAQTFADWGCVHVAMPRLIIIGRRDSCGYHLKSSYLQYSTYSYFIKVI